MLRAKQFATLLVGLLAWCSSVEQAASAGSTPLDFALYFDSDVRDAAECNTAFKDGRLVIGDAVTNPSVTCPDMFAWKLFIDITRQKWWTMWASDMETWPPKPYKLCSGGETDTDCCQPGLPNNPDPTHCPYFPGRALPGALEARPELPPARLLGQPVGAHAMFFGRGGMEIGLESFGKPGEPEPGRVLRQEVGEITVRNKDMFDYIYSNNLYNQQGIASIYTRNAENLARNAPYQLKNEPNAIARIDLPPSGIMIKSNWLYYQFAKDVGLKDDPSAPYIKKDMISEVNEKEYKGEHWLLSFHISTKDVPQWMWATFEHVNNPGRCDFTGCNDSFGYESPDANRPAGTAANFTAPHSRSDQLGQATTIFSLGEPYPSGPISTALKPLFEATGIGTTDQKALEPTPSDKGWLSYRLKGTQVNFTNMMGRPTRLGNSVTEGGFMATSSCVSCHARASIMVPAGQPDHTAPALGVFSYDTLSEVGYTQSASGVPQKDWFHGSAVKPALRALQTDFMWGMPFFAKPLVQPN